MKKAIIILYILVAGLCGWLGYACYCDLTFDPDRSAGIIVSALGVMVTLLVGWQIFNAITFKDAINRINELEHLAVGYHEAAIGVSALDHSLSASLFQCIVALERLNMARNAEYENIANALRVISEVRLNERFAISVIDKRRINNALRNSHNPQCEKLIGAFDGWPEN